MQTLCNDLGVCDLTLELLKQGEEEEKAFRNYLAEVFRGLTSRAACEEQ